MDKIYVGFSYHKNSWISKSIQLAEGSEYSHVYIRKDSKYGEYVYQASGLKVNFMNVDIFRKDNVVVEEYEFDITDDQKEKTMSFFIKYAGADYATSMLFKLLLVLLARRVDVQLHFESDGDKTFICSELGAFFCEEILEIPISEDIDMMTPKDLNPIIKAHGKRVV